MHHIKRRYRRIKSSSNKAAARIRVSLIALSAAGVGFSWPIQSVGQVVEELSDIIVTAQKRAERAQDIPMSITAISGRDIDRAGARDFTDLLRSIPGMSYSSTQLGLANFSIRGISTTATNPTVGIYMDDVSLVTIATSFSGSMQPALVDMERVEVLKGPQGTLYGGSAMGGAIKYVTKKPVLDQFSITAGGEVATVDHGGVSYAGESAINLPLVDQRLAIRLGGAYRFDAGYIDNIKDGLTQDWTQSSTQPPLPFAPVTHSSGSDFSRSNFNFRTTTTARISALYEPADSLTVVPVATIQRSEQPNPDEFFTNLPRMEASNRFNEPTHDDFDIYSLDITQGVGEWRATLLTGYVKRRIELDRDFSLFIGSLVPALFNDNSYNTSATNTETLSEELRLASVQPDSAVKWTAGLYYSRQHDEFLQAIDAVGSGALFADGTDLNYATSTLTHTDQIAAFGELTYALTRQWSWSAGLRWFDIRQRIDEHGDGAFNGGHTELDDKLSANVGVTPKVSAEFRISQDHLLYASAGKGFRPGGPNPLATNDPECTSSLRQLGLTQIPSVYQSDSLWSYEIGTKNEMGPARAVVNAALFYTDWKMIQQAVTLTSCALQFEANVGAAAVRGAELSADVPVGDLSVGGSVTYTRAKVTQSAVGVVAQTGQDLLNTPTWMGNMFGEYRFAQKREWIGSFRADYEYHGSNLRQFQSVASVTYPNATTGEVPDATQIQSAYHVVNASIHFDYAKTQCRLFIDNLTDSSPFLDFRHPPGFSAATTLRPRTVGIGFKTEF
jgi:iron complex outermembrane receptor protein